MRYSKPWLLAVAAVFAALSEASALPVPKLPPETTGKPSVVVRIRPVDELVKDAAYIAKLTGQQDGFDTFKAGMEPVIDAIDGRKPLGIYATIGPNGIDSYGIAMIPIKNQKAAIELMNNLLNQIGLNVEDAGEGLHAIKLPPFGVVLRFANGYVYATTKNTPEAELALAVNKLYAPEKLFEPGDTSLVSATVYADTIPNALKRLGLEILEKGFNDFKANELPRQPDPIARKVTETIVEELAIKVQSLIVDVKTVAIRLDFDRIKEDMALNLRVTPRPGSDLASDFSILGAGKSVAAGILTPNGILTFSGNIAVPASIKKTLEPIVDELVVQGAKKAGPEQDLAKEILDALAPTLKAGILDFAFEFRGPNAQSHVTMLAALNVKDADRFDGLLRKVFAKMPANKKGELKLDLDKVGGVALHEVTPDGTPEPNFGPNAKVVFAFRKDSVVFAMGPATEAHAAVVSSLESSPKTSPVLETAMSVRKFAPAMDKKHPGAVEAAKKAFPAGSNDVMRLAITGGESLEARASLSTRALLFFMQLDQGDRLRGR